MKYYMLHLKISIKDSLWFLLQVICIMKFMSLASSNQIRYFWLKSIFKAQELRKENNFIQSFFIFNIAIASSPHIYIYLLINHKNFNLKDSVTFSHFLFYFCFKLNYSFFFFASLLFINCSKKQFNCSFFASKL